MKTIYIVMGTVGEYSDRDEWPVVAYDSEVLAEQHVTRAAERGREIVNAKVITITTPNWNQPELSREQVQLREKEWRAYVDSWRTNEYDPKFTVSGDPATYFFYETELRLYSSGESAELRQFTPAGQATPIPSNPPIPTLDP